MWCHIFRCSTRVCSPVRREGNTFWRTYSWEIDVPAFPWITYRKFLPQFFVLVVVVGMNEVQIEATDIGFDLDGTVVTPVVL
jgi:hypothetical protein